MPTVLRMSDAASLALHAMVILAEARERRVSAKEIATDLSASEAHLAKVLQRLAKAGLVESVRGRGGGFRLARPARRIKLMDVYQAIEGKLPGTQCLLGKRVCKRRVCVMGGLLGTIDTWLRAYLSGTRLSDLASGRGGGDEDE
jgi:Rrf2 family protein